MRTPTRVPAVIELSFAVMRATPSRSTRIVEPLQSRRTVWVDPSAQPVVYVPKLVNEPPMHFNSSTTERLFWVQTM